LDGLQALRRTLRPELLAESRKHKAAKLLRQIPCIGPIRAAREMALFFECMLLCAHKVLDRGRHCQRRLISSTIVFF